MIKGTITHNTLLKDYTSFQTGGPARTLFKPADAQDLINFLKTLPTTEPLLWLGLGSNTLIRDEGFAGTVIVTQGALNHIEFNDKDNLLIAEAGVACAKLARHSARLGLKGLEFLAGIPGTMGGALRMNAGCHGGETWDTVTKSTLLTRTGDLIILPKQEFKVAYRQVISPYPAAMFLSAAFQLPTGNTQESLSEIKELLDYRQKTQPIDAPSCGSVFRNPPNDFAARIIESCGLKGYKIGGASVSLKHANFIVNENNATSHDIETLITTIQQKVLHTTGIKLIPEVHII